LSAESEENNRRNGRNSKTLGTSAGSFELLTPRDREGSFEPQIVKKRQTSLHPELEAKVLSMFASGVGYNDIVSHSSINHTGWILIALTTSENL
jgi:transposase-like protein